MIGIIVAMKSEARLIEAMLEDKVEQEINGFRFINGKSGDKRIVLMQSGIGKVCAAVATREMICGFSPDYILSMGVAGGIDECLRVMDIVVGSEVVYHDVWCGEGNEKGQVQGMPARYKCSEHLFRLALEVKTDINVCGGLMGCGDQFITDRQALEHIKESFPEGLAVDMESGAIAQVCYMFQVPFLTCRIISDTPGKTENHALQYKDFWTAAPEKSFEVLKKIIENI